MLVGSFVCSFVGWCFFVCLFLVVLIFVNIVSHLGCDDGESGSYCSCPFPSVEIHPLVIVTHTWQLGLDYSASRYSCTGSGVKTLRILIYSLFCSCVHRRTVCFVVVIVVGLYIYSLNTFRTK